MKTNIKLSSDFKEIQNSRQNQPKMVKTKKHKSLITPLILNGLNDVDMKYETFLKRANGESTFYKYHGRCADIQYLQFLYYTKGIDSVDYIKQLSYIYGVLDSAILRITSDATLIDTDLYKDMIYFQEELYSIFEKSIPKYEEFRGLLLYYLSIYLQYAHTKTIGDNQRV